MLRTAPDDALNEQEWMAFLNEQDFGQAIAFGIGRHYPIVTPSHYIFDGDSKIELHLHRANPLLRALEESPYMTFAVFGAHVYVPGYWNHEDSDPAWGPPTSYYAAVQARGTGQIIDHQQAISDLLNRQLKRLQPERRHHIVVPGDNPFGQMLRSIRGISITINEVHAKFKFGGNHSDAHRLRVADLLLGRNGPRDLEVRGHLLRRHDRNRITTSIRRSLNNRFKVQPLRFGS